MSKIESKIETIIAILIILLLGLYVFRTAVIQRPLETIRNYFNEKFDEIILNNDMKELNQSLDIFHQDRIIKNIRVFITTNTYHNGNVIFSLNDNTKEIKKKKIPFADLPNNGWYDLPFSYEKLYSLKTLSIKIEEGNEGGVLGIGYCNEDINGMGDCIIEGEDNGGSIGLNVSLYIKEAAYDFWVYILLPVYLAMSIGTVVFLKKRGDRDETGRRAFCCAFLLNLIGLLITNPYVLNMPQLAENTLDFYYIPAKYGIFDILTMSQAAYMVVPQRLISAFFVKLLGLGTNSLYCMQLTAVLIDSAIASSICLNIFRMKVYTGLRFALALMIFLLFSVPMEGTYFNFIYLGYFLIAMLICCNLDELKRYQYVALCVASAFLCISKGFYAVMFPLGLLSLILFWQKSGIRKNVYFCVISSFSAVELFYSFIFGGSGSKWFSGSKDNIPDILASGKVKFLLTIGALLFVIFVTIRVFVWNKWVNRMSWQDINIIMLSILFLGSLIIGTVPYGGFGVRNLFDWGGAWYIPPAIAMIVLFCNMVSWELPIKLQGLQKILSVFPLLLLGIWCVMSIGMTKNHMGINYNCATWDVYKKYFDETVVPVFKYDERFGTLSDECTLWYSGFRPYDNYEYGAPYEFRHMSADVLGEKAYLSECDMGNQIEGEFISAVYLNYLENVGNQEVTLKIYNESGELLQTESQITPLSSKTIGFILSENVLGASYMDFTDEKGGKVFVGKDIYIITKN
jgi:hypothetical protein